MKFLVVLLVTMSSAFADTSLSEYPLGPIENITPGSLCQRPSSYRYEERIPYCNRDVDKEQRTEIFREYRRQGFTLPESKRSQYKIDHLIPLCAGGSNRDDNLWPQHQTIYVLTDNLEHTGCQKLKEGKIRQAELVDLILAAKKDLSLVSKTLKYLRSL